MCSKWDFKIDYINFVRVRFVFSASAIRLAPPAPIVFFRKLKQKTQWTFQHITLDTLYFDSHETVVCRWWLKTKQNLLQRHQFAVALEHLCKSLSTFVPDGVVLQAGENILYLVNIGSDSSTWMYKSKIYSLDWYQNLIHFQSFCKELCTSGSNVVTPEAELW